MCGFAGLVNLSGLAGDRPGRQRLLEDMLSRIAHRGPDDETFFDDGILALGFRRLSIVDVEGGRQPLQDDSNKTIAVVNGEIYNHQELRGRFSKTYHFRSHSDSEVLLPLYHRHGLSFLDDVNGIYATALWDTSARRLILARDRLGVKPLYFAMIGDTLLFASELKALLAHPDCPREPDWQQVQDAHALHLPVAPSFVRDIHHLPAAHMLILEQGRPPRAQRYWSIHEQFADPVAPARHTADH
ncbi:MAG: asparagine synthetase B, partial [Gammaproteobacteria bacterium]|nr:asparagine synthetase B [Gammaproteobacteria bacterium]